MLFLSNSYATLESGVQVAKVIQANQKIVTAGNELGMSAREMFKLKQSGKLKNDLHSVYENMFKTPAMRESFEKFVKAEEILKPYVNKIMPEGQIKELIHQAGVETFPRPVGVPDNFVARLTDKGAGIEYIHPTNVHITVRVMPGKPHSSFEYQHNPYVIQKIEGKIIDELGRIVDKKASEAHIPLSKFVFKGL